jgi:hypothetical protein
LARGDAHGASFALTLRALLAIRVFTMRELGGKSFRAPVDQKVPGREPAGPFAFLALRASVSDQQADMHMTGEMARASRPLAALRDARAVYSRLTERLIAEVSRLGEFAADVVPMKEFAALMGVHHKALSTLIEFEARIEKQIAERVGRGRGEFDLRRARDEIMGKLAGLKAALGAGKTA